jgi:cardiolipin synthase (CMP-forming)
MSRMRQIVRHLPNILTVMRMAVIPFFAWAMIADRLLAAMWLFLLAQATDMLDGFIARKYNVETVFGRIADPAADKLIQLTALFLLAWKGMIPLVIPCLFFIKELFMLICGILAIRRKMDTSARWYGKAASGMLFMTIMLTFVLDSRELINLLMWACVCTTLFAFAMYGRAYLAYRRKA